MMKFGRVITHLAELNIIREVENYGVVGFDEYLAKFDFVRYKYGQNSVEADLHENHDIEFGEFVNELEVIENIHSNPELLEVNE